MSTYESIYDLNIKLYNACLNGQYDIVSMFNKGDKLVDWNYGLRGACIGGYYNIALLMIEKGANDWNYGLYFVCSGGYRNIALLIIEKGANIDNQYINLSDDEVYYLLQKKLKNFGKYEIIRQKWKEWISSVIYEFNIRTNLNTDLMNIIIRY